MELISRPCYATRDAVKSSLDFKETARLNSQVDRALESAADNIDGELHRVFYPEDAVRYFDWPNYQYAYPWRIWFEQYDLWQATQVTTGGQTIPLNQIFFEPVNKRPGEPFTYMELDRSTNAAFGVGQTPQRDVAITGTWGYTGQTVPAGTLGAAMTDTTGVTVTVTDASQAGVGNVLICGTERLLVQDRQMVSTGVTFTGPSTANASDNMLTVPDGTLFHAGEVLLLDAERMLITEIAGNTLILKRQWDGSVLAAHTTGLIFASRQLTVARGQLGTTAATHLNGAALSRHQPPALIRSLAVAEAGNMVLQELAGYARTVGGPDNAISAPGTALADLWDEARTRYGRKMRIGVI